MSDNDTNPRCDDCGLMKKANIGASMTSWISVCTCDSVRSEKVDDQQNEPLTVKICRACGKRFEAGRAGSFTQWIFRADVCDCEKPEPVDYDQVDSTDADDTLYFEESDEIETELDIDASLLPLERYKPLKEVGQGAWGSVYLCLDKLLGIRVAVKCMKAAREDEIIRFQKEAKLVSKLEHSHIIKVMDFGVTELNAPYMVMEYYDGVSLKSYIEQYAPIPVEEAIALFSGLSEALLYTHKKNIFHGDITSMNILVKEDDNGNLTGKLVDFGLALEFDRQSKTAEYKGMTVVGTPAYMAPDQTSGKDYDARSEIYSLGCVLFETLTGQVPFLGNSSLDVITSHAKEKPPDPESLNPDLLEYSQLTDLITKCLEKDPEKRVQTMADFRDYLVADQYSLGETSKEDEANNEGYEDSELEVFEEANPAAEKSKRGILSGSTSLILLVVLLLSGMLLFNIWNSGFLKSDKTQKDSKVSMPDSSFTVNKSSRYPNLDKQSDLTYDPIETEPQLFKNWHNEPVYQFNFSNPNIGDAETYIAGNKARLDWNGIMTLFLLPPKFNQFYLWYSFDTGISDEQSVKDFFKEKFDKPIDFEVSKLKVLGKEEIHGYMCNHCTCLVDGVTMEFWATKDWDINEKLERMCAKVVGVPPGYGIPLKAYKTYTARQMKSVDTQSQTYRLLNLESGNKAKTIPWLVVHKLKKMEDQSNARKLFFAVFKYLNHNKK